MPTRLIYLANGAGLLRSRGVFIGREGSIAAERSKCLIWAPSRYRLLSPKKATSTKPTACDSGDSEPVQADSRQNNVAPAVFHELASYCLFGFGQVRAVAGAIVLGLCHFWEAVCRGSFLGHLHSLEFLQSALHPFWVKKDNPIDF
jgi:hypothetical protein